MPESHAVSGLKARQADISRAISEYQAKIISARADLKAISEALRVFGEPRSYSRDDAMFVRGELSRIVLDALREAPGGLIVDDLVVIVMQRKGREWNGMDAQDATLFPEVRRRAAMAIFRYNVKGYVRRGEKRGGLRL